MMTTTADLPLDVLERIVQHPDLAPGDVMSAGQVSRRWLSVCRPAWRRKRAAEIQESWCRRDHLPSAPEAACAAALARLGHLRPEVLTAKAAAVLQQLEEPSLAELTSAAALAAHSPHTEVDRLNLQDLNISAVPAADLGVLCSKLRVRECTVEEVIGDLSPIFSNITSDQLGIRSSALTPADTQQLVAGMVRGVRSVMLGELGTVTLHMETLAQYDGRGQCEEVLVLGSDMKMQYGGQVKAWMQRIDWKIDYEDEDCIMIKRK